MSATTRIISIVLIYLFTSSFATASYIYTYTGSNFDNFSSISGQPPHPGNFFTTADNISMSIEIPDLLPSVSSFFFSDSFFNQVFDLVSVKYIFFTMV